MIFRPVVGEHRDGSGNPVLFGEELGEAGGNRNHLSDLRFVIVEIFGDGFRDILGGQIEQDEVDLLGVKVLCQFPGLLHDEGIIELDRVVGDIPEIADMLFYIGLEIGGIFFSLNADPNGAIPFANVIIAFERIFIAKRNDVEITHDLVIRQLRSLGTDCQAGNGKNSNDFS